MLPKFTRASCALMLVASALLLFPSDILAQTPTITSGNATVLAGPDYATDTLADPWDFSNPEDLSPFPDELAGWTTSETLAKTVGRSAFISNGAFVGRTATGGGNIVPLLYRDGVDFVGSAYEKAGKAGHYAISTGSYGKLAVRMTLSQDTALNSQLAAYWYSEPYGHQTPRGTGVAFRVPKQGTRIYIVDLVTGVWTDDRGNPAAAAFLPIGGLQTVAWNGVGVMRGFQFRPTSDGNASVDVNVDWVRVTQRDGQSGAATVPITFSGCNTGSGDYSVEVESSAGVWDVIHTGTAAAATQTANVNYGVLPPGVWNLRVTCFPINRAPTGGVAVSSTPIALTINAPPLLTVLEPDAAGLESADFATDVLRDPWDMNALSDVTWSDVTDPAIVQDGPANAFQATGTSSGDPQVTLLNGTGHLISTRKYRVLTFTMTLDTPFDLAGSRGAGSHARVFWGSQTNQSGPTMTTTNDTLAWPGRNTYTFDLAPLTLENQGLEHQCLPPPASCPQIPWGVRSARFFRIDPHEATIGVRFRLGPVYLRPVDEVALGSTFSIQYSFSDASSSGSSYVARIYIDTDRDIGTKRLLETITAGVTPNTTLSYSFDPVAKQVEAFEAGYYIYIEIVETTGGAEQTRGAYSTGILRVFSTSATNPTVTILTPAAGSGAQPTPFTITGCAFDQGNASGINMDDLAVYATAVNVPGVATGTVFALGFGSGRGTLNYGPLTPSAAVACASISDTTSPFRNSGWRVAEIFLQPGTYVLRAVGRSTISGEFTNSAEVNITVSNVTQGPRNLRETSAQTPGTAVFSLAWDPPAGGPAFAQYQIQVGRDQNFTQVLFEIPLPSTVTSAGPGSLPPGTYFIRVRTLAAGGAPQEPSNTLRLVLPWGSGEPPSAPTLTATQVATNPITLSWARGATGGAPTSYTIIAGTTAGGSQLGEFPMGTNLSITAPVNIGLRYFVRVRATNSAGAAVSNEINFQLAGPSAPGAPTMNAPTVSAGRTVSLSWTAPTGAVTSYTILARATSSPTAPVIVAVPGVTGTTFFSAPGVAPGTYFVSVKAHNGAFEGPESNIVQVVVQ